MPDVAVIGAGHAGVEAAFTLAKQGVNVTLYSDEAVNPYFRPRLTEVAFGKTAPESISMKPVTAYETAGITFLHQSVEHLNLTQRAVNHLPYDGIILAQGARPFIPPFKGVATTPLHTLWSMADALALRKHCTQAQSLLIIGGGVLGLEAALRATFSGMRVTLIEHSTSLLGGRLGKGGAEDVLQNALSATGINLKLGATIAEIEQDIAVLSTGERVKAEVMLCTTGAKPNTALASSAGLTIEQGVSIHADLSVVPCVYAAGDIACLPQAPSQNIARRASLMGTLAANNLLAEINALPRSQWSEPTFPLFMKVNDIEVHLLGDCVSDDLSEERIDTATVHTTWKSILKRGDSIVGLRWIGTRDGFTEWSKHIQLSQAIG